MAGALGFEKSDPHADRHKWQDALASALDHVKSVPTTFGRRIKAS